MLDGSRVWPLGARACPGFPDRCQSTPEAASGVNVEPAARHHDAPVSCPALLTTPTQAHIGLWLAGKPPLLVHLLTGAAAKRKQGTLQPGSSARWIRLPP